MGRVKIDLKTVQMEQDSTIRKFCSDIWMHSLLREICLY